MVKVKKKTKKKIKEFFGKTVYWVFFLFLVYLIYELLHYLLGQSFGFEAVVVALLVANLGYSFYLREAIDKIDSKISGHIGWHKGKNSSTKFKKDNI